jgi:vitamin B12 transporter
MFIIAGAGFFPAPIPKLNIVWHAMDRLFIKNNYYRNYKFPDFTALYLTSSSAYGNSGLRPEDSWGGDIGAEYRLGGLAVMEAAFFGQWTRDMILWYDDNGTQRSRNGAAGAAFGVDAETRFAIPVFRGPFSTVDLSLSYRFLYSEKPISAIPSHSFGFTVDVPWKTGSFLVSGHFSGERYIETGDEIRLDPFFLLTLSASQQLDERFALFMTVRNVFNMPNETFQGFPSPGLTISLGFRANFEEHY